MKTPIIPALILALGSFACAVNAAEPPAAPPAEKKAKEKKEKKPLAKGMTAEEVMQIVGKPAEVKAVESPEGNGEMWLYRRVAKRDTTQVATSVIDVPVFSPMSPNLEGTMKEVVYSTQNVTYYQVTALLMVEGKLVYAKQWVEKDGGGFDK
jgi:hypothetical protein